MKGDEKMKIFSKALAYSCFLVSGLNIFCGILGIYNKATPSSIAINMAATVACFGFGVIFAIESESNK